MPRFQNLLVRSFIGLAALALATFVIAQTETGQAIATQLLAVTVENDAAHPVPVKPPSAAQYRKVVFVGNAPNGIQIPNDATGTLVIENVAVANGYEAGFYRLIVMAPNDRGGYSNDGMFDIPVPAVATTFVANVVTKIVLRPGELLDIAPIFVGSTGSRAESVTLTGHYEP